MLINVVTTGCIFCVYFVYYKMRFNELNQKIKSLITLIKWRMILSGKEKLFLEIINEHNELSLDIGKMNLFYRKT